MITELVVGVVSQTLEGKSGWAARLLKEEKPHVN